MSENKARDWSRDPARSREAILAAAEKLFANQGYEQTSLQQIGHEAGVSRGTPGYFFGSKDQLYGEVLDRLFEAEYASVEAALRQPPQPGESPDERLANVVGNFYDFLLARPTFIQMIEREAIGGAKFLQNRSTYLKLMSESMTLIGPSLVNPAFRPIDPTQLLLSIMGMCWFPLAHTTTILIPFGIDVADPEFWETRKKHIVDLVINGIFIKPVDSGRA